MADYSHFFFEDSAEIIDYKGIGGGKALIPERDELQHATNIEQQYLAASESFNELRDTLPDGVEPVQGSYTLFYVDEKAQSLKSLDTKNGARLLSLRHQGDSNIVKAAVYIPQHNQRWLSRKISQFRKEPLEEGRNRRNKAFINSIEQVEKISLQDFFPETFSIEHVPQDKVLDIEMWVLKAENDENKISEVLKILGVRFYERHLVFEEVFVYLIGATKEQLVQILGSLECISEMRPYYSPSTLLHPQSLKDEREYVQLLAQDMMIGENLTR